MINVLSPFDDLGLDGAQRAQKERQGQRTVPLPVWVDPCELPFQDQNFQSPYRFQSRIRAEKRLSPYPVGDSFPSVGALRDSRCDVLDVDYERQNRGPRVDDGDEDGEHADAEEESCTSRLVHSRIAYVAVEEFPRL